MRTLVVLAHPAPESFAAALAQAVTEAARAGGHEVRLLDLCALGFDPVMGAEEWCGYRAGAPGETRSAGSEPLPLSLDGSVTWLQAIDPDTGAATLSVFDVMDRIATELQTPGRSNDAISQGVLAGVADLDAVADRLQASRSRLGTLINRSDSVEVRLSQQALTAAAERSAAEDLDMVQAVSDFQNQQTGYDAALKAYSIVQRLTLFDYVSG